MKIKIRLHYSTNIEEKVLIHQDDKALVQEVCQYLEAKFHINSPALFIDGFKLIMDEQLSRLMVDEIIDAIEGQVSSNKKVKKNESQKQIISKPIVVPKVQKLQLIESTSESESEDVKIKAKPNQKQALHQKNIIKPNKKIQLSQIQEQESDSSETPNKQKQNQSIMKKMVQPKIQQTWTAKTKTQEKTQAKIQQVSSSDDSSSENLPKPNQQNKLLLSIKSPEIEIKEKQLEWKKTFQQSSSKTELNKKIDAQPQFKKSVSINLPEFFKITIQQLDQFALLLQAGDQIQFKYVYLDVSKFQPAISSITKGKIIENNNDQKKLKIFANNQELLLAYTEFKEIEIDIANLNQERKDLYYTINGVKNSMNLLVPQQGQEQIQIIQENKIDIDQNDKAIQKEELLKKKSEIDPHNIGQQINYYFSDKNYLKDDYILQHTAQHPEKYMLIKLLLNFPRVKKVVPNEQILFDIIDIQKKVLHWSDINFEIKQQEDGQWLIRKKLKNQ